MSDNNLLYYLQQLRRLKQRVDVNLSHFVQGLRHQQGLTDRIQHRHVRDFTHFRVQLQAPAFALSILARHYPRTETRGDRYCRTR